MIHLIHGPAGAGKSDTLLHELEQRLARDGLKNSFCLLVPHQNLQDQYAARLSLANASVLTGQFVQTYHHFIFERLKQSLPRLHLTTDRINRHLLRQLLIDPSFSVLGKAAHQQGLLLSLLQTVQSLRSQCLSPEQVQSLLKDIPLSSEFGKLYEKFHHRLQELHLIDKSGLTLLATQLIESGKLSWPSELADLYLDRLFPLNAGERHFLKLLARKKPELNITICHSFDFQANEDPYLYPAYLELGEMADQNTYLPRTRQVPIDYHCFSDPLEEMGWIASSIKQFVGQGTDPGQIAVVVSNPHYASQLLSLLARDGISCQLSQFDLSFQASQKAHDELIPYLHERFSSKIYGVVDHLLTQRLNQASSLQKFEQEWEFECREFLHGIPNSELISQWKKEEAQLLSTHSTANAGGVNILSLESACSTDWPIVFLPEWTDQTYPHQKETSFIYPEELTFHPETREVLGGPGFQAATSRHQIEQLVNRCQTRFFVTRPACNMQGRETRLCRLVDFSSYEKAKISQTTLASSSETQHKPKGGEQLLLPLQSSSATPSLEAFPKNRKNKFHLTELETYLKCPYQYYARYHLKLPEQEKQTTDISPKVTGKLLHKVLHRLLTEEGTLYIEAIEYDLYLDRLLKKATAIIAEEAAASSELSTSHSVIRTSLLERLTLSLEQNLREEIRALRDGDKKTKPHLLEWAFGTKDIPAVLFKKQNLEVSVSGRIDRIDYDASSKSFSVIDYKSGTLDSAAKLADGRSLQLPIYMMICQEHLFKNQNLSGGFLIGFGETKTRTGLVIKESADSKWLSSYCQMNDEKWDTVRSRVSDVVTETAEKIQNGEFEPSPREKIICTYCSYREICRYEPTEEEEAS